MLLITIIKIKHFLTQLIMSGFIDTLGIYTMSQLIFVLYTEVCVNRNDIFCKVLLNQDLNLRILVNLYRKSSYSDGFHRRRVEPQ